MLDSDCPLDAVHEFLVARQKSRRREIGTNASDDQLQDHLQLFRRLRTVGLQRLPKSIALDRIAVSLQHFEGLRIRPPVAISCSWSQKRAKNHQTFPYRIGAVLQQPNDKASNFPKMPVGFSRNSGPMCAARTDGRDASRARGPSSSSNCMGLGSSNTKRAASGQDKSSDR